MSKEKDETWQLQKKKNGIVGNTTDQEAEVRLVQLCVHEESMDEPEIRETDPPPEERVVLTKGVAGIGKTVSVQKFILDWIEGFANQDIHLVFPIPFRVLNLMENMKLSLLALIQRLFTQIKDPKVLASSEYRTMFIFDGLDECRLPLDFHSNPRCCEVTEPASVDVLLTNLINGNLLPSALVWITTRPAAAGQIPPECVDQVTEIRGFNDPQKDDYFKKRISDEHLAMRVIRHLKSSRSLYIMCHIPVFSWILASVAERISEQGEIPRTLTQMYSHFLNIQTCIKKEKYTDRNETDEEMVFKMGRLAFQQLEKGNLIFYEEDLRESSIDVTEASVFSGVCTQIFRAEAGLCHGRMFSFVHLTIQEFLAALYVFLCFCNSARDIPHQSEPSHLSALFRAATLEDLHKTAVDLALQSENGHLDLFLRFLLGLSVESNQKLLRHLLPPTNSQPQSLEQTVQYVKNKIRHESESDRKINLFYCLNELNKHAVVEHIDRKEGKMSVEMLLPGRWKTRRFRFDLSEEQLDGFDLQKYIKTPEEDLTDLLSPDDVLKKLVPAVSSALLEDCCLTEKSCAAIAAAASSNSCSLKRLQLDWNKLQDTGVQHLSELLQNPQCKLETLEVGDRSDGSYRILRREIPAAAASIPDTSHWVLVEPEVSTENSISTYTLSSPAGSYECLKSRLRWSCDGPVTLQYRFMDWQIFAAELVNMQCSPAGPLMDIKLLSGNLEDIHLPHFLCLGGSQSALKDAVKVLHKQDSGVFLEKFELSCFHARLVNPSFSPFGNVFSDITSWLFAHPKVHTYVMVYQSITSPQDFRCYLLPEDPSLNEKVEEQEKKFRGVPKICPHPPDCLQMNDFYSLSADCVPMINPIKLKLRNSSGNPNFFQVELPDPAPSSFHLQLFHSAASRGDPVWRAKFKTALEQSTEARNRDRTEGEPSQPSRVPGQVGSQMAAAFVDSNMAQIIERVAEVKSIADHLLSQDIIGQETYANIQAETTSQDKMRKLYDGLRAPGDEGKLAFYRMLLAKERLLVEELWTAE
ncbi:protein NLRC3-like [Engraulis encrasicolus]|uniref:protein NLRC3-like n=1 Tax=Engraulis encrasicolus TaxID=184585 RepID=UPI002FD4A54A